MGSGLETSYRGHTIRFSENEERWRCYELDLEHASLSKLKEKIAAHELQMRKRAELPAVWRVSQSHKSKLVFVADYGPKATGRYETDRVTILVEGDGKRERVREDVKHLAPDTPEVRALVEAHAKAREKVTEAHALEREALAAIPFLTWERLSEMAPMLMRDKP